MCHLDGSPPHWNNLPFVYLIQFTNNTHIQVIGNTSYSTDHYNENKTDAMLPVIVSMMLLLAFLQSFWIMYKMYHRKSQNKIAESGHSLWSSYPSNEVIEKRKDIVLDSQFFEDKSFHYDRRILYGLHPHDCK